MTLRETVFPALLLLCVLSAGAADVPANLTPQENWNVVLTPVVTEFHGHAGLDHHQPGRKLILSANTPAGTPHSFELLAGDGRHAAFSNVAGLQGDVLVATARDDGQGTSRGGFQPGTLFASTGVAGAIARISADGASVQNPWVVLPGEAEITGLHIDRTGVFAGDLLVVTSTGGVWRVSSSAAPTRLAALDTRLAGVAVVPDDALAYGSWAGKVLVGAKARGSVYAIDALGQSVSFDVGLNPQDIDIVPAHENLYAIDPSSRKLLGAADGALTGIIGDILVTQESPGRISRVRWDGTGFVVTGLAEAAGLKQVAFSPAGVGAIPAVKQVYEKIAVVRRAPQLDSGRVEGTLWQLTGEDTLFDGTDTITSDLLVPGTPTVTAATKATYGGTIEGTESAAPSGYKLTITGSASLRHVVTRTDPITLQEVAFPPATPGTRDVQLRKAGETIGDPATLRHLDIGGNAGSVAVPPGTYGKFTVSGRNTLVLGVEGSGEPTIYNLEELTLSGGSSLRLAGPVVLRVRNAVTLVGATVGAADDPKRLRLEVAHGRPADAVKVGGNGVLYAIVRAPRGKISIYGNGRLRGTVACDFLHVDGSGVLQITENDLPPPPVNRPPSANAGPDHTITLPTDTVALSGTASDDGLPAGSTLAITWTLVSGPAPVTFAEANSAATSATFTVDGEYVLKLTASDGQLLSSDTVAVTVVPRNQAPIVDAGLAQTIELPAAAELHGEVTDDALPRGVTLAVTWSMVEGPGEVTFADARAAVTTASFSVPGVYTLRLSANDTEFTITDDVVVTVLKNVAPSVDAGLAQTIELPASAELRGTVTDDALPRGVTLAVTWSLVAGPGAVTFTNAQAAATTASFSAPGVYTLRLSANDTEFTITDDVVVTVLKNVAPAVHAGVDHTITLPIDTVALEGTATDDGLPLGSTLSTIWTKISGPGEVVFANAASAATTATFSLHGEYVLKLTASDGQLSSSDTVAVTVIARNQAPVVDAGLAQTIELPAPAELRGSVTDDALPRGMPLTVTWSVVEGPGEVTFADTRVAATTASFSVPGVYTLRLSANDTEFTVADDVIVTVLKNVAPTVVAGLDRTITLPIDTVALEGTATDDGLPSGSTLSTTWTKVSGPGEVVFANAASAATTATFSIDGNYVLQLTASDGQLSASDTVTVTVIPRNEPPVVDAGQAQTIKLPAPAALNGTVTDDGLPRNSTLTVTWSVAAGPGPVTFADARAAVTTASFTVPGVYTLRLSASDTELTVSDDVVITVLQNLAPTVNAGADQTITLPSLLVLRGTAGDDGQPAGSTLEAFWTQISGPVPVIFHDAFATTTPVTFTTAGTYVLRLTASDSELSATDEVTIVVLPQPFTSRTYTLDADFGEGNLLNVTRSVPHQLQLDDATRTFNFIWVAVSSKGTIVKIDTETGAVLGEYFTSPDGQPRDPSRTTVDNNGNVWAGNRAGFTVVNVGLVENGQCVDRNNNGVIDTSTGFGDVRPWPNTGGANTNGGVTLAQDECILHYTRVAAERVRHVSVTKDNDVWVTGWGGINQGYFDLIDGKTGLVKRSERSVGYGGYGGLVDKSGILWSARGLLRWDTSKPLTGPNAVNGMAFTLYGGRATWDRAGKTSAQSPSEEVWVDDRVPAGAAAIADGDPWNWTSTNPAPFSGAVAHQSNVAGGTHQHYFDNAADMLTVGAGDTLFAYVYIDPANVPGQVMLQWNNADWNWEHRAYWGVNHIGWGVHGTESRYYMGPIPTPGQWARLEVPASLMGLEGSGVNWRGYDKFDSYGLCIDPQGNVWNTALEWNEIRKFAPDGRLLGVFKHGAHNAQGCVVDKNGDVWVAHSRFDRTVGRLRNDGTYVGKIDVGNGPTGVAVDAKGKIWATNHNDGTVARIDPTRGTVGEVDFRTPYLGGSLYNYSDMTGSTLTGKPEAGTWSTVFDSKKAGAEWGRIGWTASACGDGQLTVSVATSENGTTFGPAETVTNGADPAVANGRYLRVTVSFKRASSGESPILYDLSVGTSGYALPAAPNTAPTALAGADLTTTLPDAVKLGASACDDGFPRGNTLAISWTQVSGPGTATFTNQGSTTPTVTFTVPGDYVLRLTVSDGQHSVSDEVSVTALPANLAPAVNAGPDQTITLPNAATLNGTVSDDGLPAGGTVSTFWSQVSGPGTVTFNDPDSPVTGAIFPATGTYTLRLTGGDSHRSGTDDVFVTVNPSPALNGATLALVAGNAGPYVTGTSQPLQATLRSSTGTPLANYGVELKVTGPNATSGSAVTNASGVATFIHSGTNLGTDTVTALVRHTATANIDSPAVTMTWAEAAVPAVQGWIGDPRNGSTVTGIVPVTVGAGMTLTQATVEYWPAANPSAVTVLAANAQGGPGATLATLDTTLLANGNYVIRLSATGANGETLVSQVLITVTGENKPGRVTLVVTDLTVPVTGIPITIERQYDSLERNEVGDFGYGWSLEMAGPRLQVSPDYDVTITEPGTGRRVTFQFNPTSFGFPFSFLYQPAYSAEPGVYGKLATNGCGTLVRTSTGVACYLSSDPTYRPTTYTYTDPYGRVYTMTAAGKLVSIRNLDGNVLTFSPSGITSSAGNLTVSFARDSQGRITDITDPTGKVYGYTYDAAGDLVSVELPGTATPLRYEYAPGHYFLKGTDARGNAEATNTYYADGRLQSVTDAQGKTTSYAYDLVNRTTTITHPDNTGATTETYDVNGLVLSTTDPLGRKTSYTYDANRNKRTETDALNKTTTYDYDANGHLRSVTDPSNKTQLFINDEFGQPVTATDQLGKTRTLRYDGSHNPAGVSDELGTQVAVTWSDRGNPLTFTDANGKVTHLTYDPYGNILSKTDPLGRTTSYTYDTMGRVLTMTDLRGVTRFAYDDMGRMLSVTDPLSNKTRYEYDANGNRTAVIDAKGRTTEYEYDAANRVSKITYPDGTTHSYTYDFRGQKETETVAGPATAAEPVLRTTSYHHDNAGQLVKVTHPDGSEINRTYDEIGRLKTVTDELNKTVTYEYDPNCGCRDRLAKITDHNGNTTTYTYDAAGRRISFVDAANRETRYTYDVRNRLTKTTFADSTFAETTFDAMGRPLTSTDQEGRVTRYAYDEVGNLLSVTDANGATTQYTYDVLRNLLSSTDANGNTTRFEYDALNRLVKRVLPLGMAELYTYDQVGNRITKTDFRGKQTSYEFDPMNRPTARRPDPSLGEPAVTYSYTATGMRRSMTDTSGTTAYTYDQRDRLLTKQTPQGTLTYTHNAAGRLTSMRSSNAGGVWVDYTYDDLHRLESVIDHQLPAGTTAYSYDVVGNLKSDLRPNGVRADYTYDALNRLTNLGVTRAGTAQASYGYTLDRTGRRLSVTEGSGRKVNYTYDAAYRLTREAVSGNPNGAGNGAVDYTLDRVGNRLSRVSSLEGVLSATSVYDANDRLVSDAYDANGNTRSASGQTFVYDFENRITSASSGAVRITYDGDGNLAAKAVSGVTTRYLVDDLNPTGYSHVVEEIVNGQVQRQYTYGHTILSQRRRLAGGWAASFYSADGHGSIRQLTDETGTVTDTYTYDAFGKLISSTGTTPNAYRYAGERFDADLGLYHLRARYYDADRGRFFSMDPHPGKIDDPVSLHKYLYANADPVNFTDPSGLSAFDYARAVAFLAGRLAVKRASAAAARARVAAMTRRLEADRALSSRAACIFYVMIKAAWIYYGELPGPATETLDELIARYCS